MTKDLDKKVAHAMELHYERGFIDGMQKQMQSSVDMAVNRMAQTQEPVAEIVSDTFGCLSTKWRDEWTPNEGDKLYTTPPKRTWVGLTDEEIQVVAKQARSKDHAVTLTNKLLRDKNT
jgi:hypothetical protein